MVAGRSVLFSFCKWLGINEKTVRCGGLLTLEGVLAREKTGRLMGEKDL